MTDKPEPTAEHVDAPRLTIVSVNYRVNDGERMEGTVEPLAAALAANLPTDVMLAALVERGALREKRKTRWVDDPDFHGAFISDGKRRRYVTRWTP